VSPQPKRPELGWCTGKDCRKVDGFADLRQALEPHAALVELPCLDVCDGAVVVLDPRADKPIVLRKLRTKKGLADLIAHVAEDAPLTKRLLARRIKRGDRAKARRRVAKALRGRR